MSLIEFGGGELHVDAVILADEFGLEPSIVPGLMREGKITNLYECGVGDDVGSHRVTFFFDGRRFRLVVDENGNVTERSTFS